MRVRRGLPRFGFAREGTVLMAAEGKKKVKPAGREERKMMSFLVCLWPGKRGKKRRWFRWGERLRVSVSFCGEEKKKKKAGCRKTGQEKLIL
jgi:hypothetical protein